MNLAGNALKFTQAGGILIAISVRTNDANGLRLRCEVVDTGIGISEEQQPRIFEKFAQLNPGRFGGMGLGLAICRRLADALGGEIGVASAPGEGSTFWVEAPFRDASGRTDEHRRAESVGEPALVVVGEGDEVTGLADVWGIGRTAEIGSSQEDLTRRLRNAATAGEVVILARPTSRAGRDMALRALASLAAVEGDLPLVVLVGDPASWTDGGDPRWFAQTWRAREAGRGDVLEATYLARSLRLSDHKNIASQPPAPQTAPPAASRRLRVLVADDNAVNRSVIAKILERAGHEVSLVDDGQQALHELERDLDDPGRRPHDVALLDCNMPIMDGVEATQLYRLASLGRTTRQKLPILALTADATEAMAARCRTAGMDDCLIKPVRAEILVAAVEEAVAGLPARGEATDDEPPGGGSVPHFVEAPVLDERVLDELRAVGGQPFVADVLATFSREVVPQIIDVEKALATGHYRDAQAAFHAIASASAMVGAVRLRRLCLSAEQESPEVLRTQGRSRIREVRRAIQDYKDSVGEVRNVSRA